MNSETRRSIPMNLQFFAEPAPGGTGDGTQNQNPTPASAGISEARVLELIKQAQPAVDKGLQQKENAVLKSYFEQQGLTAEEAAAAMTAYKKNKQDQAKQESEKYATMQKENETLKAQILQGKIDSVVTAKAGELGIDAAKIPLVKKLAEMKGVVNDKGEIDEAKVKTALEDVLKAVPEFKGTSASTTSNTGFQIGGKSGSDTGNQTKVTTTPATATKRWNRFN